VVDERVISTKLSQIEQYYGELQEKQSVSKDIFLEEITEQRAVERMFENAILACADLAKHVATERFGYEGEKSREAIELLEQNDVVSGDTARTLVDAVGFRNILAHEYGDVDPEQVYEYLQHELDVYEAFSQQIARWYEDEYSG
jgi:uncharacterized protein YutE (UPF0331/DUF86 family)